MFSGIIALLIALSVHEFSHALAADRLGDPTPRLTGRLTLNPLAHLDFLGTLSLIFFHFGWGKPVEIDPFNLQSPRRDQAIIALAGPSSNLLLAGFSGLLGRFFPQLLPFLIPFAFYSLAFGFFNLLPFHPMDGAKVFLGFLPQEKAQEWESALASYSLPILVALIIPFFGKSLIEIILLPLVNFFLNLFFSPGSSLVFTVLGNRLS